DNEWVRCTLGPLYNGLKNADFYWGVLGNYIKISLIFISNFFLINNRDYLPPLLISLFYSYRLLLTWKKPYASKVLYQAENCMMTAYLVLIFCAHFMSLHPDEGAHIIYLLLIVLANSYAIGY